MTRQEFFYYNAGSSHDPLTETPDEGRVRGAMQLAEAEAYAQEQGWTFEWDHDDEGDDANDEACQLWSSDGTKVLASLFGITGATEDYRRVVEAELALQAMGWPAKAAQKPQEAAAASGESIYARTGWSAGDVMDRAEAQGIAMTEEQAVQFLLANEKYIVDAMVSAGYDAIDALLD